MDFEAMLGGGYVVAADSWMNVVIVWNGSATFRVWSKRTDTDWAECEAFTVYDIDHVFEAKTHAKKWIDAQYDEIEEYFGQEAA